MSHTDSASTREFLNDNDILAVGYRVDEYSDINHYIEAAFEVGQTRLDFSVLAAGTHEEFETEIDKHIVVSEKVQRVLGEMVDELYRAKARAEVKEELRQAA